MNQYLTALQVTRSNASKAMSQQSLASNRLDSLYERIVLALGFCDASDPELFPRYMVIADEVQGAERCSRR